MREYTPGKIGKKNMAAQVVFGLLRVKDIYSQLLTISLKRPPFETLLYKANINTVIEHLGVQ